MRTCPRSGGLAFDFDLAEIKLLHLLFSDGQRPGRHLAPLGPGWIHNGLQHFFEGCIESCVQALGAQLSHHHAFANVFSWPGGVGILEPR